MSTNQQPPGEAKSKPSLNLSAPISGSLPHKNEHIALIGLGGIGVSFLALHLRYSAAKISVYDPRPDLREHIDALLPVYLSSLCEGEEPGDIGFDTLTSSGRVTICPSLAAACSGATIVQEQVPETLGFKHAIWSEVTSYTSPSTHLWSSTSGIPASKQLEQLRRSPNDGGEDDQTRRIRSCRQRLLVVHPFSLPHVMPLLELVPSPETLPSEIKFARTYFKVLDSGHQPITIHKETAGFVANRLSYILFREACSLVHSGVVSVEDVDDIVRASLGPRLTLTGPFKMYGFAGGKKGLGWYLANIAEAIDEVWRDAGTIQMDDELGALIDDEDEEERSDQDPAGWKELVIQQTTAAYGEPSSKDIQRLERGLKSVIQAQAEWEAVTDKAV